MADAGFEPEVVFRARHRDELAVPVWDLKHKITATTILLPIDVYKTENGPNGAQEGILGGGQRDEVFPGTKLVIFRLLYDNNDAVVDVVSERFYVLPAENHLVVDTAYRLRNQIA